MSKIEIAKERFQKILEKQLERVERINNAGDFKDFTKLDKIIIGICGGDGIGPFITKEGQRVLEYLLKE